MADLSQLSDAQLDALIAQKQQAAPTPPANTGAGYVPASPTAGPRDLSHLSDDQLDSMIAAKRGEQDAADGQGVLPFIDNEIRAAANGATLGYANRASAVIDAATHGLFGRGSDADTFSKRYDANLAYENARDSAFAKAHPVISNTANIVGGVAGLAKLPTAAFATAPRAIGTGALIGAVQGSSEGDDLTSRLENAAAGGVTGATLSAATPAVGSLVRKLTGKVAAPVLAQTPEAVEQARRQALSAATGVPLSQGQQTGNLAALNAEDVLRQGGRGGGAQQIAQDFGADQLTRLQDAVPLGAARLSSADIGDTLGSEFRSAQATGKAVVDKAYASAFDPDALAMAGVAPKAPGTTMSVLGDVARGSFDALQPLDAALQPRTARAVKMLDKARDLYGQSGTTWNRVDDIRQKITGALSDAYAAHASDDIEGLRGVLSSFDAEVGKVNPLLNQARQTFGDYADVFRPQTSNAPGVNALLKSLGNDANPGQTLFNKLFGPSLNRGEAEPLVGALKTVYANNPAGMQAVQRGALQRLAVDRNGQPVSALVLANNIDAALGANSPLRPAYEAIFDPATLHQIRQAGDTARIVAQGTARRNGSSTAYTLMDQGRAGLAGLLRHKAAATGAAAGWALGGPVLGPVLGTAGGAVAGAVADSALNRADDMRAVNAAHRAFNASPVPAPLQPAPGVNMTPAQRAILAGNPTLLRLLLGGGQQGGGNGSQ